MTILCEVLAVLVALWLVAFVVVGVIVWRRHRRANADHYMP
jgi:hypothetical protein